MDLIALAATLLGLAKISKWLMGSVLTAPMLAILAGLGTAVAGVAPAHLGEDDLHLLAEGALVLLLFIDASRIAPEGLKASSAWAARMLLIGLPLAFGLGLAAAWLTLPGWSLAAMALLAAVLTPTDAALGKSVIEDPNLDDRVRRSAVIESGLNDGLALPLVLLAAAMIAGDTARGAADWATFAVTQIALGAVIGAIPGYLAARMHLWFHHRDLDSRATEGIGVVALAAMTYVAADMLGGNGFIAAFVGGAAFGIAVKGKCEYIFVFPEREGEALSWLSFFLIGFLVLPVALPEIGWREAAFLGLSLAVVRPLAIWLSLAGSSATPSQRLFFGWFGPRGLATAIFAIIAADRVGAEAGDRVLHLAAVAILASAVAHGISAGALRRWRQTGQKS
ncbi:MAG: cation:proton antiporter [Pseudomonadota bacterium]